MAIILGSRSLARLDGVHPNLVRVVARAAAIAPSADDFTVLEGVRSIERMQANYGQGRTVAQCLAKGVPARFAEPSRPKVTWLDNPLMSAHRRQVDGFGRAVDLAPFPIDWAAATRFDRLAALMLRAAGDVGVPIRWGGDWDRDGVARERGESDLVHFELI